MNTADEQQIMIPAGLRPRLTADFLTF